VGALSAIYLFITMKGLYEIINTTLKVHERANFGDEKARDIITKIMCKKVVLLMKSQGYEVDYSGMNHIHNLLSDESD
jgi:hypothetical protein